MKKILLTIALGAVAGAGIASAQSKFDGPSRIAIDCYQKALVNPQMSAQLVADLPFAFNPNSRAASEAEVMVGLNKGCTASMLAELGYEVLGDYGDFVILKSTIDKIIALEDLDAVKSIAFSTPATPCNDLARTDIGMDKVFAGTGLPRAYTGKGVVAAIFDTGSDPNHIMFRNADGSTRYKRFYNYASNNGSPKSILTTDSEIKNFTTENSKETHATHTTGCMAGSFKGATTKYMGNTSGVEADLRAPAYEADIIGAYGTLYPSSYLNFLEEVDKYRKENGVPVVVNFSFGSHGGPLDATNGENPTLDRYAKDFPIFISSSNEGDVCNGIVKDFKASDNMLKTFIYPAANHENERMTGNVELWSKDDKPFKVTFVMYDKGMQKELAKFDPITGPGTSVSYATKEYTSSSYTRNTNFDRIFQDSYITVTTGVNSANNRYYLTARLYCKFASTNSSKRYVLAMYVEGEDGQHVSIFNGAQNQDSAEKSYGTFRSLNVDGFTEGTPELSINRLCCGNNTISIGAYTTRMNWKTANGSNGQYYEQYGYYQDKISPFSSYGILHNGTTLPHFIAPGAGIISSISSYQAGASGSASVTVEEANRNNFFAVSQGTSMSSPVAAGVAVVMLQANPNLSSRDIRDILVQTARVDGALGDCPTAQRGAGKIDAYEAVKKAVSYSGVNDIIAGGDAELFIRPVGDNVWEVSFPGLSGIAASVYSISGQKVADFATAGDTMEINVSNLTPGIYVLNVNGKNSTKIVVK